MFCSTIEVCGLQVSPPGSYLCVWAAPRASIRGVAGNSPARERKGSPSLARSSILVLTLG